MRKKIILAVPLIIILIFGIWVTSRGVLAYRTKKETQRLQAVQDQAVRDIINAHNSASSTDTQADPFGEDNIVRILFIGLDKRVGEKSGHCDMIQLITIDKKLEKINITAVPRGTYSPLPAGKGTTSSAYYVSNACGLGGLDYGIAQIEKILGAKADYLAVIGFSETMGILRSLKLPTTETVQWLRNRHGYTIGEPQRAHNHSTFIKQMIIKFTPIKNTNLDKALQYIVYKLIKTNLSFAQTQKIIEAVMSMDIPNHPEKISLSMRPFHPFKDIAYDPDHIDQNLDQTLGPIKKYLSKADYSGMTKETLQAKLLDTIEKNKNNPEFISWAYENNLWLQIEDSEQSLSTQYDLLVAYIYSEGATTRKATLADYILEMENRGEPVWEEKGKQLLLKEIN